MSTLLLKDFQQKIAFPYEFFTSPKHFGDPGEKNF